MEKNGRISIMSWAETVDVAIVDKKGRLARIALSVSEAKLLMADLKACTKRSEQNAKDSR